LGSYSLLQCILIHRKEEDRTHAPASMIVVACGWQWLCFGPFQNFLLKLPSDFEFLSTFSISLYLKPIALKVLVICGHYRELSHKVYQGA